jgi:hypothetical protein
VSRQNQRALLLRHSVAEFERRVNAFIDYGETYSEATLGELEAEARQLSRDCFGSVLEGVLGWRAQEAVGFPRCRCGQEARYKGQQPRSQETYARDLCRKDHLATRLLLLCELPQGVVPNG